MANRSELYTAVNEELARRRDRAIGEADANREALHRLSPEAAEIDRVLSCTAMRIFEGALKGGDGEEWVRKIEDENKSLLSRRAEILKSLGLPADYTDPHFTCPKCSDTGYQMTRMCSCRKQLLQWEGMRASGIGSRIDTQTFDTFSLDYYKGGDRERMAQNLTIARHFADTFRPGQENLLLLGGTGLGKTHLSTAIARRVVEGGWSVVYETVQTVFGDFEHDRFRSGYTPEPARADKYLSCDLLILDDLGTEFSTAFTVSCLYQLVNTRSLKNLSTVISTNLTPEELNAQYDQRLTSRLLGLYRPLLFAGTDIRYQKLMR